MKIVFSRKGFDAQYGRVPSPVLEDGTMVPLPIPSQFGRPLADLQTPVGPMHQLVADLTAGALGPGATVHLDPDLQSACVARLPGWRGSLGQVAAAQGHLTRQGVGPGDLFLFFGWFRRAERHAGKWRYVPGSPSVHALFGWLQVDQILDASVPDLVDRHPWLVDHPHVRHAATIGRPNRIYLSRERSFVGAGPGSGVFERWDDRLQLTSPGRSRSVWRVPAWMGPAEGQTHMSYHHDPGRWKQDDDAMTLRTVGKGQEFVVTTTATGALRQWLEDLLNPGNKETEE